MYERTDKLGRPYIVVKSGFVLLGVISPYDLVNEGFVQTLEEILNLSKVTLFNKQEKSRAADGYKQIELGEEVE